MKNYPFSVTINQDCELQKRNKSKQKKLENWKHHLALFTFRSEILKQAITNIQQEQEQEQQKQQQQQKKKMAFT